MRGKERRSFWTHLRGQCASHFYLTYGDLFSTIPRNVRNAKDVALQNPSPEHHESFRVRCWTPCKKLLTAKVPIEELLRADVSRQRYPRRPLRRRMSVFERGGQPQRLLEPIYKLSSTRARRQTPAGEEQASSFRYPFGKMIAITIKTHDTRRRMGREGKEESVASAEGRARYLRKLLPLLLAA